jgi:phenylalanyl-tRNA synthetase beta chain
MRQTLIFNLLEMIEHNQNRQNPDLRLFEYGKVYHKFDSGYSENQRLMLGITGERSVENWNSTSGTFDFYSMKGFVTALLERLGLDSFISFKALKKSLLKDGMEIYVLKQKVGEIGWVSGKQRKHFGIKNEVFVADLDWDALIDSLKLTGIKYKELPKSFAVRRDFSLLLDEKVTFKEIEEVAQKCDKKILREVALFDVYEGDKLDQGKKSYAVSFTFQDDNQTLKDKQVDAVMEKIRKELEEKLSAQLRG